jgi:hypothetical protein
VTRAACTIVSPNYLAYARTVASSYMAQHPDHRFFVLIVADLTDPAPFQHPDFTPVLLPHLGVENLRSAAMMYDILELNTNVKPTFMKFLIEQYSLDVLTYLDPDIFVYAPLTPVFEALDSGASAVLTPHMTTPVFDGHTPSEQEILYNGTYNLGFISVRACTETTAILNWWERRCLDLGFSEGRTGLFVDQKWMNLAPGLFANVAILRDPGCNMAYWNIHERALTSSPANATSAVAFLSVIPAGDLLLSPAGTPPVPLRFFHFSGIVLTDPTVLSKNTNRFTLADRPDLQPLFAAYKTAVLANKDATAESLPYGFDTFSDGTTVTRLARRLFAEHQSHFTGTDPFDANAPFARFARDHRLVQGTVAAPKSTWKDFSVRDRRVEAVHSLLKLALRLLGPHRYELLMRYLAHISVLRHQSIFLRDKNWPNEHQK